MKSKAILKKKKKPTITALKKKLWSLVREEVFKKYGNNCYTCGATNLEGANRHLGHFLPSSICSMEMRYSLDNLRPSCYRCNIHLSGNWVAYEAHLKRDGIDVEELKRRNEATKNQQYGSSWVEAKISEYQRLHDLP